jgi:hypothetical protein
MELCKRRRGCRPSSNYRCNQETGRRYQDYLQFSSPIVPGWYTRSHEGTEPPRMWEEIKKSNRGTDAVYVGELMRQFRTLVFDPTKGSVRQYVNDLEWFRTSLSSSVRQLTEEDLREQLLLGLPDDPKWANAKNWCLRDKLDFKACISLLQSNEPIARPETAIVARDESRGRRGTRGRGGRGRGRGRGGRGRGRGGRGRGRGGRGRGRGGRYDRSGSRSVSNSRVDKSRADPRKAERDECKLYYKTGHFLKDCYLFKQMQVEQSIKRDAEKRKGQANQAAESSNVVVAEESDSDALYYAPPIQTTPRVHYHQQPQLIGSLIPEHPSISAA